MKRREFIHDLSHAAALSAFLPAFDLGLGLRKSSMLNNTNEKGNILIIIKLNGGNDGLNTVVPLDQYGNLTQVRPHVILPENKILPLNGTELGFHPSLSGLKQLHDEKRLKIIQNVGYDNPSLSHFRSMDIWQTASDYGTFLTSGWVGRYVENRHPNFPEAYPNENYPHPLAIELPWQNSLSFTGEYSFPGFLVQNPGSYNEILNDLDYTYPQTYAGDKLRYAQLVSKQSNLYGGVIRDAYNSAGEGVSNYPEFSDLGGQFRTLSKLIRGGLNTRLYMTELFGFDTHEKQVDANDHTQGAHTNLLQQINDCVMALMKDLDATGDSDRVMIMTFSEFGRRIASTASGGTDHGTAAPMLIIGNKLNANVLGRNPEISLSTQWHDNLPSEFDFRQVYASVIEQWLGGDETTEKDVLHKEFQKLPITGQYLDADGDGVFDKDDLCNDTPQGAIVDATGCEVFSLPSDTFRVVVSSVSCAGQNNGAIELSSNNHNNVYSAKVDGVLMGTLSSANGYKLEISRLEPKSYEICFEVVGIENYQRCYSVQVTEPPILQSTSSYDPHSKTLRLNLSGASLYKVVLNGRQITSDKSVVVLPLASGNNKIEVSSNIPCQGLLSEEIFVSEEIRIYPNPTNGPVQIYVAGSDTEVQIKLLSVSGKTILSESRRVSTSRTIELDLSSSNSGVYILKVEGETVRMSSKIIRN